MKNRISPTVRAEFNESTNAYDVEIQLPGAHEEDIDLKVLPGGFMIRAPRTDLEDTEYIGSYAFCCPVDEKNVKARFEDGLLTASFKLAEPSGDATKAKIA